MKGNLAVRLGVAFTGFFIGAACAGGVAGASGVIAGDGAACCAPTLSKGIPAIATKTTAETSRNDFNITSSPGADVSEQASYIGWKFWEEL